MAVGDPADLRVRDADLGGQTRDLAFGLGVEIVAEGLHTLTGTPWAISGQGEITRTGTDKQVPVRYTAAMSEEDEAQGGERPQYRPTKVRLWLKKRGKKQAQLADYLGLSRPQVTRILSGQRQYTQEFLEGAAVFLDVRPSDLLEREPDAPGSAVISLLDHAPPAVRQEIERFAEFAIKRATGDS